MRHGPSRAQSADALRENFFRLFLRSYHAAEKQRKGLTVYHSCADLVHRLCGERWAWHTVFPAELALVRRFLGETGLAVANPDAVTQLSLMANPWAFTWSEVLRKLDPARFASVCSASGEEILSSALAGGRGVICAQYHTLFAPLYFTWLDHKGLAPGVLIREWVKTRDPATAADPKTQALEGARELKTSLDTLRQGGIVHIMADGYAGNRKTEAPFCNRRRGFETTFAALSQMTGAPVITVVARFQPDGRIRFEIGPALADEPTLDATARSGRLLQQFVTHMRRHWQEHPSDIPWFQMHRHLSLPTI